MTETERLTSFQADIVSKIRSMRDYTLATGFRTHKSQNELLGTLGSTDLAAVLQALPPVTR